ncbi:FAD/NAD-P-binding domain-containing protein [Mycena amicta]|nr:FAD/NAD-P-binding domain-containing protein [Mycena amicta]
MPQTTVAVLGSGAAGLVTAHVLSQDGFDVRVFTRDRSAGGQWTKERIYPGLQLNTVHGEFSFSGLAMERPQSSNKTGGRLTGIDLNKYMEVYADEFLQGKIEYETDVLAVRRENSESGSWVVRLRDMKTGVEQSRRFDKIVLCTGGTNKPWTPPSLTPPENLKATVIHSAHIGAKANDILEQTKDGQPIVVIGGGKSAQDISALMAKHGRKVTIVYEQTNSFTAYKKPLPDRLRRGRFMAIMSPYPNYRSRLEHNLHTTWLGGKIVRGFWDRLVSNSIQVMRIPKDSPLRHTYPHFWNTQFNDEGIPRADGMIGYSPRTDDKDGSWFWELGTSPPGEICSMKRPQPLSDYIDTGLSQASTTNGLLILPSLAPPHNIQRTRTGLLRFTRASYPAKNILKRDFAINGAIATVNGGYTFEVIAHLRQRQHSHTRREDARWFKKRYPSVNITENEALHSWMTFFNWSQFCDELLEDMHLRSFRSGRNWLTWAVSVVDVKELATLHAERVEMRSKGRDSVGKIEDVVEAGKLLFGLAHRELVPVMVRSAEI